MDKCYLPVEVVELIFAHIGYEEYLRYFMLNIHAYKRRFDKTFWALHLNNGKSYVKFLHHLVTINDVPLFEFLLNGIKLTAKQTRKLVELVGSTGNVACFRILMNYFKNIELVAMSDAYHAALYHRHLAIMEVIFSMAPMALMPPTYNLQWAAGLQGVMKIMKQIHESNISVTRSVKFLLNEIIFGNNVNDYIKQVTFTFFGTLEQFQDAYGGSSESMALDLIKLILKRNYGNVTLVKDIVEKCNICTTLLLEDVLKSPNRVARNIILKSLGVTKLDPTLIKNSMAIASKHLLRQFVNDYPNEARDCFFLSFGTFDDEEYTSMIKKYNITEKEIKQVYNRLKASPFENLKLIFEENWPFLAES